jgi:predicted dehydrogenase
MNQKSTRLQVGLLGGAINSAVGMAHYSAIRLVNGFEIVTGCFSRHHQVNVETALHFQVDTKRAYKTLEEMLEQEHDKISAVIILTPTDQHAEQVIKCLNSGVAVICEKALACNIKELLAIEDCVKRNNGFLSVIYNYLGYPMIRELREKIKKGQLGMINHIQIEMPQEGFLKVTGEGKPVVPQEWRLHDGLIPTISLDLGVHLHMLIKYLTNKQPLRVVALSQSLGNFANVKDNVSSMICYEGGTTCNIWFSKIALGNRNGMAIRLYGDKGSAEWVQENSEYLKFADNKGARWTMDRGASDTEVSNQPRYTRFKAGHPAGFIEAFANYYEDIFMSLQLFLESKNPILNEHCFGIHEALEGLRILQAMEESNLAGQWTEVLL